MLSYNQSVHSENENLLEIKAFLKKYLHFQWNILDNSS